MRLLPQIHGHQKSSRRGLPRKGATSIQQSHLILCHIYLCIRPRHPQLNVYGEATPNVSGALEVLIESTGALVHSKKGGDGYVDTPEKMQKIKDAVKAVVK